MILIAQSSTFWSVDFLPTISLTMEDNLMNVGLMKSSTKTSNASVDSVNSWTRILLLIDTRRFRRTPPAAKSFDEQDGCVQALTADADGRSFICQSNNLGGNYIQVTDNSRPILVGRQSHGFVRGIYCLLLHLRFFIKYAPVSYTH